MNIYIAPYHEKSALHNNRQTTLRTKQSLLYKTLIKKTTLNNIKFTNISDTERSEIVRILPHYVYQIKRHIIRPYKINYLFPVLNFPKK